MTANGAAGSLTLPFPRPPVRPSPRAAWGTVDTLRFGVTCADLGYAFVLQADTTGRLATDWPESDETMDGIIEVSGPILSAALLGIVDQGSILRATTTTLPAGSVLSFGLEVHADAWAGSTWPAEYHRALWP